MSTGHSTARTPDAPALEVPVAPESHCMNSIQRTTIVVIFKRRDYHFEPKFSTALARCGSLRSMRRATQFY